MKNKKNNKSSTGFEDMVEEYLSSDEYSSSAKREQDQNRSREQYELQHFLEQENTRLSGIETFLTKKIPAKINFSQTEKLIIQQMERKTDLLEKTVLSISKPNSSFQHNLAQLFNAHFG